MNIRETQRLIIRRISVADAPFMLGILNEPSWLRFIGDRGVRTQEEAVTYIRDTQLAMYERLGFGFYIVALKDAENTPIGVCGVTQRDFLDDVDLGYALLPQYSGQGYAFEAASAVLAYARDELKLARLVAFTRPENHASQSLLRKLGLRATGSQRHPDGTRDIDLFEISFT